MEIIIRKSYLFWDGDAYKYGGFGQIIQKCSSVSEAEDLIEKLTVDFLRNDNPMIKDFVYSNNDYVALIEKVSSFFEQEFKLNFDTDFWLPASATDSQVLELSKLFSFPFYSVIEKENDHFYINELNDAFWTESEITAIKISAWDFTTICPGMTGAIKQLYNDAETAKKDGSKKLLSHLVNENYGLFSKLENVNELQFVHDWHNQVDYYAEILPNNIVSEKTDEIMKRIKRIVNIEDAFKTKEISFEEAMAFEEIM
ncbi:hypothetical protein [Flavobacterium sp. HJSW_4]|uniref:hypothetical protein n=1 Tax=Flavobacterium sp. HJSW_4 TaxID=3344660 RepID=UPI0035F3DE92